VAPNKSDLSSRRYRYNTTEPIFMNQGAQEGMDVTYSFPYNKAISFNVPHIGS
jgi:hypothetical protein